LNVAPGSGGTTVFTVQHHFVTQAVTPFWWIRPPQRQKKWCPAPGCSPF
jgi:hypothetical protein